MSLKMSLDTKLKSLYEESITCTSEGMVRYYNNIIPDILQNVNLCLQA